MKSENANSYMYNKKRYTKNGCIEEYRYDMVKYALKYGISATAREFKTDRKTVRKWVTAYKNKLTQAKNFEEELESLKNKSRLGQYHPNKLSQNDVDRILELRGDSRIGAYFIKDALELDCSQKTIHKKLVQNGKIKKTKTKTQKKRDMSEMRKKHLPLQKLQIDVKYLCDIPNIFKDIIHQNIPKYQITVRDYKIGLTFIGFSYSKDSTAIGIFVYYVLHCLRSVNIDLSNTYFQPDNGSEFRCMNKKYGFSLFEEILRKNNVGYWFIPPAKPTFNSDVESFHNTIEREFYDLETLPDEEVLLQKAWFYMMWYNCYRKNRNKGHKAPLTLLKEYLCETTQDEKMGNIDKIALFPPIIVDKYVDYINLIKEGGELKWLSPTRNLNTS